MRIEVVALVVAGLGASGCAAQDQGQSQADVARAASISASIQEAINQCDAAFPLRVGGYSAHAECLTQADESVLRPIYPYPDLLDTKERSRADISARIDSGQLSIAAGQGELDGLAKRIATAEEIRRGGEAFHQREVASEAERATVAAIFAGAALLLQAAAQAHPAVVYVPPPVVTTTCTGLGNMVTCHSF